MFHLVAFGSSISNSGALLQLDQITDEVLAASNNGILVPPQYKGVMGAAILGASVTRGQLQLPSLRNWGNQDLEPVNVGTKFESPVRANFYLENPLPIVGPEELDMYAAQTGAAAETDYALVWITDGVFQRASGRILQAHFTASTTLTAGAWSTFQPTLDNALAAGTYALVGARVKSATGMGFRMVPNGAQTNRPGGICTQAVDDLPLDGQRAGGWGVWMSFTNYTVPNLQILASAADTSEEGILDLIPL